ncbi:hypothetical protein AWB78_08659 [Caballeronia calidae]|uniref:HEAT repeat protein n=2 Tax=Caballeronia calidae TaxID=1777139 RepID=A0A158ELL2_9BURK|nr:hypothetical protein AWB78_08659 [Caballeronia calidae]
MLGADATKYVVKKFHHLKQDQKAAFLKGISKLHNDARNSTTERAQLEQVEGLHSLILETTLEVKNSIPTEHCYEIFDALLSSIKNAGPATRSRVLTMLASKLAEIPRNRRPSMFDRLLTESDALSLNLRVRPLSALASVLNKLPDGFVDSRLRKLVQRILAQDIGDQIEPLSTLMSEIDQLSGEDRLSIVYHLLNAADSCNTEAKAPALAVLANSIELLREVHRLQVFQFVLKAIGDLESRERIEPLRALASECAELPEANRMDGLDDLLGAVAAIVDPGVKGELLHAIASGARKFFEAGLVGAFGHILASINLLDVEERAAPLLALRANIRWLPEEARQEAMHDLLLFS